MADVEASAGELCVTAVAVGSKNATISAPTQTGPRPDAVQRRRDLLQGAADRAASAERVGPRHDHETVERSK